MSGGEWMDVCFFLCLPSFCVFLLSVVFHLFYYFFLFHFASRPVHPVGAGFP